jgi:nucleotide-binding universal stress UspA family protein
MLKTRHILLASHGTTGARAAEKTALALCPPGGTLHHLIVVPDFWKGMMGDDWLNNVMTQQTYGRYVENQLEDEIRIHVRRLQKLATKRRIRYRPYMVLGKPTDCLIERAKRPGVHLVVMGSPRPRGETGLRSRIDTEKLVRALHVPLLIVPHPK